MLAGRLILPVSLWMLLFWVNYWPASYFPPDWVGKAMLPGPEGINPGYFLGALAGHIKHACWALLLLLAARGAGLRVMSLAGLKAPAPVAAIPVGLLAMATAIMGLGLAGLLYRGLLWILAGMALAASPLPWPPRLPRWLPAFPSLALGLAVSGAALLGALVPEVTYDALSYHLGAPQAYLRGHHLARIEGMFFTDMPLTLQMIYALAVGTGGEGAAKLIHWSLGGLCILQAAILGGLFGGARGGSWSAAFMAATPFLATQMMRANVDLGVMLLTGAGFYWLVIGGGRGLGLAALLLGGAASVKMTGGYGIAAAAAALLVLKRPGSLRWLPLCALPLAPWLLRSYLFTGNPAYPFLFDLFGGQGWSAESQGMYRMDMTGPTSFNLQYPFSLDRLAGPWLHFMHDRGREGAMGPYFISLLPVLVGLGFRLALPVRAALWFLLVYWLAWFFTARDPRFFLPVWPVACALAGFLYLRLESAVSFRKPLRAIFVAAIGFTPLFVTATAFRTLNPAPVLWGALERTVYMNRMIPPPDLFYPMLRLADRQAGRGRILVVGDVKAPNTASDSLYASLFDTPHLVTWVRERASAERLAVRFRQQGVAVVLYNVAGENYLRKHLGQYAFSSSQSAVLRAFWRDYLIPLREAKEGDELQMGVYRFRPRSPNPDAPAGQIHPPGEY